MSVVGDDPASLMSPERKVQRFFFRMPTTEEKPKTKALSQIDSEASPKQK